jgi:3-oxoacyl-[acyl-carrier-protein] synthase III
VSEAYLDQVGFALGGQTHSVEDAGRAGRLRSDPAALREAGFDRHHVCLPGETAYDLARAAAQATGADLGGVDALIYSTCLPQNANLGRPEAFAQSGDVKHLMDFPASHLQAELGLERAQVVGLNQQACTGLLGSIHLAQALLALEEGWERVLCLTADRFPEGALYEQSFNLVSDGAAACLVSRGPGAFRLRAVHGRTNGALARASDDETAGSFFAWSHRVIHQTLAKAGIEIGDLALLVAQNMNRKALEILARLLPLDPARVACPTLAEVGHVISGDNLINLQRLQADGALGRGDFVLLFMAGYGLNWQGAVLEVC